MGCCSSADKDTAAQDGDSFNDLDQDRKGEGMGAQRPKSKSATKYEAEVDMDALNEDDDDDAVVGNPGVSGPPPASPRENDGDSTTSSTTSSSSSDGRQAPAPVPAPVVRRAGAPGESLALSAAEEEAHRQRVADVHKELGEPKVMDVVFDTADDNDIDWAAVEGAAAGGDAVDIEAFDAGMPMGDSPGQDPDLVAAGFTHSSPHRDVVPSAAWFESNGVEPPLSVVWFQTPTTVQVEITPANDDVGYTLEDSYKLLYNCQDPSETELLKMSSRSRTADPDADFDSSEIVMYTTSISGDRQVKDHCRLMEHQLYLHKLKYTSIDLVENNFIRRKLMESAGAAPNEDLGLPLLFVGDRFVCTFPQMQDMIDDGKLHEALGASVVAANTIGDGEEVHGDAKGATGLVAASSTAVCDPVNYRVDLMLLHEVRGARFTVERSTRHRAPSDERTLVMQASKVERKYWSQLIRGPLSEVGSLQWISRDMDREIDSDDEGEEA